MLLFFGHQLCEDMQTCTTSAGGTLNSGGCVTIMDQQKVVKKEEPEDEGYLCKTAGCSRVCCGVQCLLGLLSDWTIFRNSISLFICLLDNN